MELSDIKIFLVPRWAGTIHSDWYDWLANEISSRFQIEIIRLEMPNWDEPNIEQAVHFLNNEITDVSKNSIFIGHSVGCQAILHFLSEKFESNKLLTIGGFLFVAGWFEVDKPWDSLQPWLNNESVNLSLIADRTKIKRVLLSDNDPFTADYDRNKILFKYHLNADVSIYKNKYHFNNPKELEVLSELEDILFKMKK